MLHISPDAFYASSEQPDCPPLRERRLIARGAPRRWVVCAARRTRDRQGRSPSSDREFAPAVTGARLAALITGLEGDSTDGVGLPVSRLPTLLAEAGWEAKP